ncbi:MAG: hypothetical protein ACK5X3_00180 [Pseudomonadota bacterium]|jgi:hypothetical protein
MTDWIKHNGGPQPVGDDVWVEVDEGHIDYLVGPARDFEWDRVEWFRWNIINQHLIDAARLEGIRLGLEAAAKAALLNSHAEPFDLKYIDAVWSSIRALDPATIAKEADQ